MIPLHPIAPNKKICFKEAFFLLLLMSLLIFSSGLKARGIYFSEGKTASTIPFQNINGLIVIPLKLENEEVNLILDSGIRNIVLFDKPGSYGMRSKSGKSVFFSGIGSGKSIKGRLFHEVKVKAQNIEGSGLSVAVIPVKNIPENSSLIINGLIGFDLFSRFLVKIDYLNSNIILQHPSEFMPGPSYQKKEFELINTKPFISYNFSYPGGESQELKLFVDTGGNFSMILKEQLFSGNENKKKEVLGYGLSGSFNGFSYWLNQVYLDFDLFNNFNLWIPTTGVFKNDFFADRDGSLGSKFLENFEEVVFDYSNQFIYFKPKKVYLGYNK